MNKQIEIKSRLNNEIILCGKYESIKECLEKNIDANLRGAYLEGANLRGAKNYYNSHDFFIEIIRRQDRKEFTKEQWSMIGELVVYSFCWDEIKKRYDKKALPILKKLDKWGFGEYLKRFKREIW